ncbi:putative signal transducing protein [Robiginitomaculum antarcticum]|uniref:putative signal transducing protein n=1 Tax=Robiginitomaculum antarcticum TaxID=437507 RepID=UPI0003742C32|nr:DUF2007 domain-containing protein [Robiginitomaculum antarcticum]
MMVTVIKTNNIVTLSFAEAVLKDSDIHCFVADTHSSIIEGSIGIIPRRIMILDEDSAAARRALELAGLAEELEPQ